MQILIILFAVLFGNTIAHAQNINITFTGQGDSTQIDSVRATNLETKQSITLPGNETLVLMGNTGIWTAFELTKPGLVYPNPCSGKAILTANFQRSQMVYVQIENLVGQVLVQTQALAQSGENEFAVSIASSGIFSVSLKTDSGISSYKIICTDASESDNSIKYLGAASHSQYRSNTPSLIGLKTSQTGYSLGYSPGDIMLFTCYSNNNTSIFTDSPESSKNYDVEFPPCIDNDGKNYSTVRIGTQTWMVMNLNIGFTVYS